LIEYYEYQQPASNIFNLRSTAQTEDSVTLEWDAYEGANGFLLERSVDGITWTTVHSSILPGDVNGDGKVDLTDLTMLARNWQQNVMPYTNGDVSGDGKVDLTDLTMLARNWQASQNPANVLLTVQDGGLQAGVVYQYRLAAVTAAGFSEYASVVVGTVALEQMQLADEPPAEMGAGGVEAVMGVRRPAPSQTAGFGVPFLFRLPMVGLHMWNAQTIQMFPSPFQVQWFVASSLIRDGIGWGRFAIP